MNGISTSKAIVLVTKNLRFILRCDTSSMTTEFDQDEVVRQVTERLTERFPKAKPADVQRIVQEEVAELATKPVTDYVSVLSERAAKKRLKN